MAKQVMKEDKEISEVPSLSLMTPASELNPRNGIRNGSGPSFVTGRVDMQPQHLQQNPRKQRRCWSPELHRRFVDALQQLGGAQGIILLTGYTITMHYIGLRKFLELNQLEKPS